MFILITCEDPICGELLFLSLTCNRVVLIILWLLQVISLIQCQFNVNQGCYMLVWTREALYMIFEPIQSYGHVLSPFNLGFLIKCCNNFTNVSFGSDIISFMEFHVFMSLMYVWDPRDSQNIHAIDVYKFDELWSPNIVNFGTQAFLDERLWGFFLGYVRPVEWYLRTGRKVHHS